MALNRKQKILLWWWYKKKRSQKHRRFWMHPIFEQRESIGECRLIAEVLADDEKCKEYLRMQKSTFDSLLEMCQGSLQREDTKWRKAVPARVRLVVTIRYLATGNSFASRSFSFRLGATTIRSIVRSTCEVLWTVLQPSEIPIPTFEKWRDVADGFFAKWNFPMCIGALDGKHIRLKKPPNTGSQYWNYKGYCSLVLMAVVDAHCRFLIIDVGSFGSSSDGGIFKDSKIWKLLQNDKLEVPNPEPIPNTDIVVPYTFVADEAFPLQTNMMRPFPNRDLNDKKRIFNYRLSRARRQVECAFGVMANMWRLLHKAIETNVHSANKSVKGICVLHNFILNKEPDRMSNYEINYRQEGINSQTSCSTARKPSNEAMAVREKFMNYFVSPNGSLSWQREACYLDENTS